MALEWAGEEEKPNAVAEARDFEVERFSFHGSDGNLVHAFGSYHWAGVEIVPTPSTSPTIVFKHGDIEKSITLSEADLKPRLKFKLHQKVDALIKQAYNK